MRRPRPLSFIIIAAWILMAGILVRREYFSAAPIWSPGSARPDTSDVESWNGIYIQGQKVGYGWTVRVSEADTLFRVRASEVLALTILEQEQVMSTRMELTLNRDFSLRSFYLAVTSDDEVSSLTTLDRPRSLLGTSFEVQGGVVGDRIRLITRQGGEATGREQVIALDGPVYMDAGAEMLLAGGGLEVGRAIRVRTFDPQTMRVDFVEVRVAARDTIRMGEEQTPAWRLESDLSSFLFRTWVDDAGRFLHSEGPFGISIRSETREQALSEGWETGRTLDLVNIAAIPAGIMKIQGARNVDSMTVRLRGIELGDFDLTFGRQELIEELVEVKMEDLFSLQDYELPSQNRALRRYLGSSPFVQTEDRRIQRQMSSIRRDERSARRFAETLVHWVYSNLEKVPTAGVPNAVEVLDRAQGDCNEHTVLFAALARAAGIPTQMNAGVVYLEGRFYYHAWPSVWLGRWIAVDPTFDQFPADATHISFLRGDLDRQVDLLKIIGRVSIDVVSYHPLPTAGGGG